MPKERVTDLQTIIKDLNFSDKICLYFYQNDSNYSNNPKSLVYYSVFHTEIALKQLSKVYYSPFHQFIIDGKLYYSDRGSSKRLDEHYIYKYYESVIAFSHFYQYFYGDLLLSYLSLLQFIPKEIYANSTLIFNYGQFSKIIFETLNFLEIFNYSFEIIPNKYLIYAETAYTIMPTKYCGPIIHQYHGWPQKLLANKIKAKTGVSNIKPTVFALTNRKKGMYRFISNFDEVHKIISQKYHHEFIVYPNAFSSLTETCQKFAVLKWIFIVIGSGIMNTMFMHKGCGLCVPCTKCVDKPSFSTMVTAELKAIVYYDLPWGHVQRAPKTLNISLAVTMIDRSLKLINECY